MAPDDVNAEGQKDGAESNLAARLDAKLIWQAGPRSFCAEQATEEYDKLDCPQ